MMNPLAVAASQAPSRSWSSGADVAVCPTTRNGSLLVAAQKHAQDGGTNAEASAKSGCATDQRGRGSKNLCQTTEDPTASRGPG
jgi:hypothetical protein